MPKLDILAVESDEAPPEEWKAEDVRSKLPVKRNYSMCGTGMCASRPPEADARARTGRNPVWVSSGSTPTKVSVEAPRHCSRLVCTEVRHKEVEPIFSVTLPLETLRVLLSVACEDVFRVEDRPLISVAEVSRAHFYADAVRDVYVRLPDKDPKAKQPGVCGQLRKTMYGSLDAAQRWGEHYTQVLETGGFSRGVAFPCHFPQTWRLTFWCTAMTFSIVGGQEERKHALSLLRGANELGKVVTLGPVSSQSQTASFMGRTLTLRQWRIEYEPDQQHVSRALKALGLTTAKGVATPGTDDVGGSKANEICELRRTAKWHDPLEEIKKDDDLLTGEELKSFQSVAARFNFLAMDRPDLLYSVKELMRQMASPRARDLIALKK